MNTLKVLLVIFLFALVITLAMIAAETVSLWQSLAHAESYTVVVSVDNGQSWRSIPLPARIVRHILDELAITHAHGQPRKTAIIQIKMSEKKTKDVLYAIECH